MAELNETEYIRSGGDVDESLLEMCDFRPEVKRRRVIEDFGTFCSLVLAWEKREQMKSPTESLESPSDATDEQKLVLDTPSPSSRSSLGVQMATKEQNDQNVDYNSDDESWNLVTCFCGKPFAGRPMIECGKCQTWIHLTCARIRQSNVPETFICQICRQKSPSSVLPMPAEKSLNGTRGKKRRVYKAKSSNF
ncbi:PHD finger protein 13-like [Oscarella lobularis]|uniref:PHD finger protein 13-like n=1 Tax=Oscarella lobularis TaxID=121494 RepID=UPI003313484F